MGNEPENNILITSANFPKGSAAANFLNLFCKGIAISGSGIEVFLLKGYFLAGRKTNDAKRNITAYGVRYTYLSFVNRSSNWFIKIAGDIRVFFSLSRLLASLFRRRKSTTIFTYNNEIQNSFLINIFCKISRIQLVTFVPEYYDISEFSGGFLSKIRWYSFLFNFHYLNRLSDKLIVFSTYLRDRYLEKGFPSEKIMVQPNLTDFDFWENTESREEFTIGYSGTPYKKDGIFDLLTSISILKKKGHKSSLVVVGDVMNEKSIIPALTSYCEKLGIVENVTFTGLVSTEEVKEWLNKCEILVITRPSITQTVAGFPTKIGEYFACRKIVLATKIGDVGNYFSDGKEIVFAEAGNPESISNRIEWILENRETCAQIATNGYKRAFELLCYKNRVPEMLKFARANDKSAV